MTAYERMMGERELARLALIRAARYAAEAAEHAHDTRMSASYIGRSMHKLKKAEGHLQRAKTEEEKIKNNTKKHESEN